VLAGVRAWLIPVRKLRGDNGITLLREEIADITSLRAAAPLARPRNDPLLSFFL